MVVYIDKTKYQVYAGDDWTFAFQVLEGDDADTATPVDLSAYSQWTAQWRATTASATAVELAVSLPDPTDGTIIVTATDVQTRTMGTAQAPYGVFDVQAALPEVRTFFRGTTQWIEDVTRA